DYPAGSTVSELFERQVAQGAEREAVEYEGEGWSYGELNTRANRLAHYLRGLGGGPEVRVGICLERSLELVAGVLGSLEAGGAYVPLDPALPRERLCYMAGDADLKVMLTQEHLLARVPTSPACLVCLDREKAEIGKHSEENLGHDTCADHLVYVIYTSGSTGKPKGVEMTQGALLNLIQWQSAHSECKSGTKTLQFAPLSFDVSFQEFISSWHAGGTVVIIPEALRRNPVELWRFIIENQFQRVFLPPVALEQLAYAAQDISATPKALKEIITAGETLRITPEIRSFFERV